MTKIEIESDHKGFGIFRLFLTLLLQFTEDLSDRELETSRLSKIFNILKDQLKAKGCMSEVFTFIDASHLIFKATLCKEGIIASKRHKYQQKSQRN